MKRLLRALKVFTYVAVIFPAIGAAFITICIISFDALRSAVAWLGVKDPTAAASVLFMVIWVGTCAAIIDAIATGENN